MSIGIDADGATALMILAWVLACACVPLAVHDILHNIPKEAAPPPALTPEMEHERDLFISLSVSKSKFGDKRRRTRFVSETILPRTGPIETLNYAVKDPND